MREMDGAPVHNLHRWRWKSGGEMSYRDSGRAREPEFPIPPRFALWRLPIAERHWLDWIGGLNSHDLTGEIAMRLAWVARTGLAGALVLAVSGVFSSAFSQSQGTQAEREACTPDVMRLCSSEIPDPERIVFCLKRQRANLNSACRVVMTAARVPERRHARRDR